MPTFLGLSLALNCEIVGLQLRRCVFHYALAHPALKDFAMPPTPSEHNTITVTIWCQAVKVQFVLVQ